MEINKYRLLLKIAEFNNITSAARAMDYTQSAASHAINSLEEELGLKVLQRTHSGTQLTADGNMLLPSIREVVESDDRVRALVNSINSMQAGDLKIGAFTSASLVCLPRIINKFLFSCLPMATIRIFCTYASSLNSPRTLLSLCRMIFLCWLWQKTVWAAPFCPILFSVIISMVPLLKKLSGIQRVPSALLPAAKKQSSRESRLFFP